METVETARKLLFSHTLDPLDQRGYSAGQGSEVTKKELNTFFTSQNHTGHKGHRDQLLSPDPASHTCHQVEPHRARRIWERHLQLHSGMPEVGANKSVPFSPYFYHSISILECMLHNIFAFVSILFQPSFRITVYASSSSLMQNILHCTFHSYTAPFFLSFSLLYPSSFHF